MTNLYPEFFRRQDEQPDEEFYRAPRFESHLDEEASLQATALYSELLPPDGHILDLMAGYYSHLPERFERVTGLGLNAEELSHNRQLSDYVVHDLNRSAELPFETAEFAGAVCTASVQYMTRPLDTFSEMARCLQPGARFVVGFSSPMFESKAILAWRASDDAAHMRLVQSYFDRTDGFGRTSTVRFELPTVPFYSVWARRL